MTRSLLVISDTSVVSSLLCIGRDELLARLFDRVLVPPAVMRELFDHPDSDLHAAILVLVSRGALREHPLPLDAAPIAARLRASLGAGESEAIALAASLPHSLLLIDEREGRDLALELGCTITGVLGVLIMAKEEGLLGEVAPEIQRLVKDAGFFLRDDVIRFSLQRAGEL